MLRGTHAPISLWTAKGVAAALEPRHGHRAPSRAPGPAESIGVPRWARPSHGQAMANPAAIKYPRENGFTHDISIWPARHGPHRATRCDAMGYVT